MGLGVPPVVYSLSDWPLVSLSPVNGWRETEVGVTDCVGCAVDGMFQL